jgi:hypothetical protein
LDVTIDQHQLDCSALPPHPVLAAPSHPSQILLVP